MFQTIYRGSILVAFLLLFGCAAGEPYMRLHGGDVYKDAEGETTGYVYRYEGVYPKSDTEKLIDIAKEAL